jgi:hypothetical protein
VLVCGNFTASLSALGCPPHHIPTCAAAILPVFKSGFSDRSVQELATGAIEDAAKLFPAEVATHSVVDDLYVSAQGAPNTLC